MFTHVNTRQLMELNVNRTDFSALTHITEVLKLYHSNKFSLDELSNLQWAIAMISHEVEQTGRQF
jgi:hypothetical protein